jgi:predicted dehydrogenase
MNSITPVPTSRREFLKQSGTFAAATALAGVALPHVHAAENNTVQIALVGCGGRGSGAAAQAMSTPHGPTKLVAMADVFAERQRGSYNELKRQKEAQVDVPPERQFVGFEAYKQAMDCLKPGDVVILATPPAFRWPHFSYAISKGLNVFMEKPVTVDGPTSRKMFELAKQSEEKGLKVGVGLMSRHSRALQELAKRVHDGEIGEIILQRGYRMHGPVGFFASTPKPPGTPETVFQVQRFHSFLWASGGNYSDFYIHIIDHLGWLKNAWPVRAQAVGGRHYKTNQEGVPFVDQNFDTYGVEYTYADGTKFDFDGRCMTGCQDVYSSYIHGTKGSAMASRSGDCGAPSAIYKGQTPKSADRVWESKVPADQADPYQNEWNALMDAIRKNQPYNEAKRGIEASLVTSMGRMAAHTGQSISYEDILNSDHEFAPTVDKLTPDGPAPLVADAKGMYPQPEPGRKGKKEY